MRETAGKWLYIEKMFFLSTREWEAGYGPVCGDVGVVFVDANIIPLTTHIL